MSSSAVSPQSPRQLCHTMKKPRQSMFSNSRCKIVDGAGFSLRTAPTLTGLCQQTLAPEWKYNRLTACHLSFSFVLNSARQCQALGEA
ncbi:uncharacterized protein SPSK_01328 [Sporothrix schenckii 1099-18]|uniref:Uncharacterized protein n=1 Tax=Sporothrix schenckii 1099-18 TaxID=1397361 RepID=A0A0F2LXT0_SPOSC|nr:uncharacterized protein SPSK_01328 [Sporothrix schenckii 1099-18]KJR81300.1 hypothetical protein SPSK_01328 [Sporothrix schenckii 1099-18]